MRKAYTAILSAALLVLAGGLLGNSQPQGAKGGSPQERYIYNYSDIAVAEMQRTGVPASITLAQGIIESGAGLSTLAVKGNNHFGIKCHAGWKGESMLRNDDRKDECFRVYQSAEESFRDHSDFLRYRDRYKFLFDLDRRDYKAWAFGLRQAGYATDPTYAAKLIKVIEDYDLARFDFLTSEEVKSIPAPPNKIEEPVSMSTVSEEFRFSLSRIMYSVNDVPFIYSREGDTYASVAKAHHLFLFELLKYNDIKTPGELVPGTVLYLEAKKTKAPAGLEKYIVAQDGEDFHSICQRFAVKEKAIRKLNKFAPDHELLEGEEIKLR